MQGDKRLEGKTGVLLPGIVNEIALHQIVPKLSWRDFYILSAVSPAWRHAIRSGQVHEVRAQLHSAQAVVPVIYTDRAIALYCSSGNSWHQLPPIPFDSCRNFQPLPSSIPIQNVPRRRFQFPFWGGCISMDGKIYVLGGITSDYVHRSRWGTHCQLYVFDIARLGKWEALASVTKPREHFACGIKDGRIYTFGGILRIDEEAGLPIPVYGGEVYDPEQNSWSPIKAMTCPRFGHCVETVGEEFFVLKGFGSRRYLDNDYPHGPMTFAEAYHPVEEKWRVVESFWSHESWERVFTARGKLFSTRRWQWNRPVDIHVYDVQHNSWTALHSFSLAAVLPDDSNDVVRAGENELAGSMLLLVGIQAVEDELLALVSWKRVEGEKVLCLLESRGFGSTNTEISWQMKALSTTGLFDFTNFTINCCPCRC